jgi:hypothetical protein
MDKYAVIGKLQLQEIEGANTLQMGFYEGLPFAVQKDLTEDDLCIIFLPDGQLSKEYAEANDCVQRIDPVTGERAGGFFGKNRKVRAVNFMKGKIRSVGYVAKIETLAFTGANLSKLKEGTYLSELNGVPIVNKFINQSTRNAMGQKKGIRREKELLGLKMHQDTSQMYQHWNDFEPGDLVTVTEKLDGTSVRFGEVYSERKFNWIQRLINKISPLEKYEKQFVVGTRRTLLSDDKAGYYNDPGIYKELTEPCRGKLIQGESIYAEIVGWIDEQRPLFERGGVKFTYSCQPGERRLFVYAIKWTLPSGEDLQLPWDVVKERAKELGLETVPELFSTKLPIYDTYELSVKLLKQTIERDTVGKSLLDKGHIREGCVVRIDRGRNTIFYKSKSEEYYMLEDQFKNDDNNVDLEEAQG